MGELQRKCDTMRKYFIYYEASSKVDYLILFLLHKAAAASRSATGLYMYNTIEYQSISQLSMNLCALYSQITGDKSCPFSVSTLSRFLKSADNELYFSHTNKTIILKNDFSKNANNKSPFVVLYDAEIDFLLKQKEELIELKQELLSLNNQNNKLNISKVKVKK